MPVRVTRKRKVQDKVVESDTPGEGPFRTLSRRNGGSPGHYGLLGKPSHYIPADLVGPDEKVKVSGWEKKASGWWAKAVKKL